MTSASGFIDLASDSDPNEIQIITLWDREVRKEDLYKIAYSIFTGRKYDSPSLSDMRDWLAVLCDLVTSRLLPEWLEAA